jgi:hypothetical protein
MPKFFIIWATLKPWAHCSIVMPDFLTATTNSLSSSTLGIPILFFQSFNMFDTFTADVLLSTAILFLGFAFK